MRRGGVRRWEGGGTGFRGGLGRGEGGIGWSVWFLSRGPSTGGVEAWRCWLIARWFGCVDVWLLNICISCNSNSR